MFLSILLMSVAHATETFTFMSEGQVAPFEGTLFNPSATAELLVSLDEVRMECDLKVQYSLDIQAAEYDLTINNLNASHSSLMGQKQATIDSQQMQILELEAIIRSDSGQSKWLWAAAGAVIGAGTTYGAYRLFNE